MSSSFVYMSMQLIHIRISEYSLYSEFNFDARFYNLIQVSSQEYKDCTSFNPVNVFNSSPTVVSLNESGDFYFMCNHSNYCCLGQKIAITVHECSGKIPPSPSPSALPSPSSSPVPTVPRRGPAGTGGRTNPPVPVVSPAFVPSRNGGYSPLPSSTKGEKSMANALFTKKIFSRFAALVGFWLIWGMHDMKRTV